MILYSWLVKRAATTSFIIVCFSGRANLKQIEEKTALKDLGACSHEKNLKFSLRNGFFSAFEQILIKLFAPHSGSPSPNMMHLVRIFSIYAYLLQARSGSRKT